MRSLITCLVYSQQHTQPTPTPTPTPYPDPNPDPIPGPKCSLGYPNPNLGSSSHWHEYIKLLPTVYHDALHLSLADLTLLAGTKATDSPDLQLACELMRLYIDNHDLQELACELLRLLLMIT